MANPYQPVIRAASGKLKGAALVGTHSTIIGWDLLDPGDRLGLLGFAVRRSDFNAGTGELMRLDWLGGYKRFKETDDGRAEDVRSLQAPFQRFRWNDYTLRPTREYLYEVFPIRGTPGNPVRDGEPLKFHVTPSPEDPGDLGIFVNRGVTAAMAYLSRFQNTPPHEVGEKAYHWLSRGLKESLLAFIAQAQPGDALHVAIYEFHDHEVAQAFKDAIDRQVDVHIVHDARPSKNSTEETEKVIQHFELQNHREKRSTVNISHNKMVIHLVGGIPWRVWTGSANFSENAFYFQTNAALIVRDPQSVQFYEDYFQALRGNPAKADSKKANRAIMDLANTPPNPFAEKIFFSPVKEFEILEAAADLINSAESAVLISAPFGVDQIMVDALHGNSRDIVEYGLTNSTAQKKIEQFSKRCTRFFTPTRLTSYMGKSWDAKAFGKHKIHTKTIVIDPWGDKPQVLIGSANFSQASCDDNDENALLISGNKRLAAIVATEFMRMFDHYKSRYYIDKINEENKKIKKENDKREAQGLDPKPLKVMDLHLKSNDTWSKTAFDPDTNRSHKYRDRIVFSGGK
ncbi:MAG: hypothetical protein JW757_08325 [Anaerolineales bacterium]|nr:hypothetical protein [Anaerolineales bacterium]